MMFENQQGGGQQPPPPPPQGGSQQWFNDAAVQGAAAAMAGAGGGVNNDLYKGIAGNIGSRIIEQEANKYIPWLHRWLNIDSLRYYFEVNNSYVLHKLMLVSIAPALHFGTGDSKFVFRPPAFVHNDKREPPKYDLHAPDLYIPTMAFVTYVLISAFALGTYGQFNPDIIFTLGWSCIGLMVLELIIIKGGLMFLNATSMPMLDVLAYSGYKFVGLTWLVIWHITLGSLSTILYYLVFLLFASCMSFFLIKSLEKETCGNSSDVEQSVTILRYVVGGLQIPFFFFMMP